MVEWDREDKFYIIGNRVRIHDSETGRIIKWEVIDEEIEDILNEQYDEVFHIVEWVLHFVPTRDERESSARNFEVRVQAPDTVSRASVLGIAEDYLADFTNQGMVDDAFMTWEKEGEDSVEYSKDEYARVMIVDTIRPDIKQDWKSVY
jgi:hypothetical protein